MKTKLMNWLFLLLAAGFMFTVACKGHKGEQGKANVKCTPWLPFKEEAEWSELKPDFFRFVDDNGIFKFSVQTIKSIAAGDYVALCYVRQEKRWVCQWPLPASFGNGDFTEFGDGRKIMNYIIFASPDESKFEFELNVTSTDATNVKGAKRDWQYRLIFVAVNGFMPTKSASADALKEELQKLSYEEVCASYGIEP